MKSRIRLLATSYLAPFAVALTLFVLATALAFYREDKSDFCPRCMSTKHEGAYGVGPRHWGLTTGLMFIQEHPSKAFTDFLDDRHEHDWHFAGSEVGYALHGWGDSVEGTCMSGIEFNEVADCYESSGAFRAAFQVAVRAGQLDPIEVFGPKPKVRAQPGQDLVDSRDWPADSP